jgi:hypothetical protein
MPGSKIDINEIIADWKLGRDNTWKTHHNYGRTSIDLRSVDQYCKQTNKQKRDPVPKNHYERFAFIVLRKKSGANQRGKVNNIIFYKQANSVKKEHVLLPISTRKLSHLDSGLQVKHSRQRSMW